MTTVLTLKGSLVATAWVQYQQSIFQKMLFVRLTLSSFADFLSMATNIYTAMLLTWAKYRTEVVRSQVSLYTSIGNGVGWYSIWYAKFVL